VSPAQMRRRSSRYLPALASVWRCRSRDKAKMAPSAGPRWHASKRWISDRFRRQVKPDEFIPGAGANLGSIATMIALPGISR
jgi:hypothetical protein